MAFRFKKLRIPDIVLIEPDIHEDDRGYFLEVYKMTDFEKFGINKAFVQVNHSKSSKGVLRGLHYQKSPMDQGKLVYVPEGEIFDVAVDLRLGSPTYGQWAGEILSAQKKNMLYIPEGFAHGFCVTSQTAQVIYYCTEVYSPERERGVRWNDPNLDIMWPAKKPILSKRDSAWPSLSEADNDFVYGKRR